MAKMNRNTWLILTLVLLNVLSLSTLWLTNAEKPLKGKKSHETRVNNFLKEELGLNNEQLAKFQDLRKEHFKARKENIRTIREKKQQLIETVTGSEADSITIQNLITEIIEEEKENEQLFVKHLKSLKEICTAEQQQNLSKVFLKAMRSHRGSPPDDR